MARTEEQWQADLFPELPERFPDLYETLETLNDLGLRNAAEARARGFVQFHRAWRSAPGLWAHHDRLAEFEAAAEAIARLRAERAEAERERRALARRRAGEILAEYPWLDEEERDAALEWAETAPHDEVTPEVVRGLLLPGRLKRALSGIRGLRPRGHAVAVAGEFEGTAFGQPVRREVPDVATIPVSGELAGLLFREDPGELRDAVEAEAARATEAGVEAARRDFEAAVAEAERAVADTAAMLEADGADASQARGSLVEYTLERLRDPHAGELARLPVLLRRRAQEAIWVARRGALGRERSRHKAGWFLAGDRKNPLVVYSVEARIEAVGTHFSTTIDRKVNLPRHLREALFARPLAELSAGVDEFVAERSADERARIDRALESLSARIEAAAASPAFDVKALTTALRNEFGARQFSVEDATSRIKNVLDRLVKKARETHGLHVLLNQARFAHYSDFFTTARRLGRELCLYVGPTNSGKTYHALNALAEGESGAYLAPLRLLALEGQEELERRGRPTSFLTGEERDLRRGAKFVSSTIEMFNTERPIDAVVVDEVQLLGDPDRGWAWSAAIIGAPAKRVYMTGSPDSVPYIEALAEYCGEPLEVRRLERFTPLTVLDHTTSLDEVEPGTAIVCFSRRDVLNLKQQLERRHAVSVIYGNLSPPVRREEARRFRGGETTILVATDAIALGLNLPIRTVLFYTTWKWNGREEVRLSPSEVRQIGGRAGRFGKHDAGHVGALSRNDLEHVRAAFESEPEPVTPRVQVRPSLHHVLTMNEVLGSTNLYELLDLFRRRIRFDDRLLAASVPDDMLELAALSDSFKMPLEHKFVFTCAPVDTRDTQMMHQYQVWMRAFTLGRKARLDPLDSHYRNEKGTNDPEAFYQAELQVKMLTVYAWLAYRFPDQFPDLEECDRQRDLLNGFIERTLRRKGRARRCANCGEPMPALSPYPICDACYRRRSRRRAS
jgi:ATP-dependent RNA helicase SUPV3L1/SUV3